MSLASSFLLQTGRYITKNLTPTDVRIHRFIDQRCTPVMSSLYRSLWRSLYTHDLQSAVYINAAMTERASYCAQLDLLQHSWTVAIVSQHFSPIIKQLNFLASSRCIITCSCCNTGRYSIYLPRRDGRLSWRRWLVTYRDGLPARRRSPIQVLTGPSVD